MGMLEEYIDLEYKPARDDLICEYYVEPANGVGFEEACGHIAGESSIDTWADILTLSPKLAEKLKPHVFDVNRETHAVKIAYHLDLFEDNSVPQLLSSIAGNIFSMKLLKNLRLQDVSFPAKYVKAFKGPRFGILGVRKLLNVKDRPLCGNIVKPKVGLSSEKHAQVAYEAWLGGIDLVKDDENLTNQTFNPFERRVIKTLETRDKAERETGERKVYAANITAPTCDEVLKRAQFIKEQGGEYAMVDIIPTGFTALQTLREANEELNLVLHAHRCMHSAMTRNPRHGISMLVIAKLVRLIGLDQLHIGTAIGKMHGGKEEVLAIRDNCVLNHINSRLKVLEQDWCNINSVFPVASGGLQPIMVPKLVEIFGKDVIMQFGGGVHAHPLGTKAGAMAVRQALDAALGGIPLEEYSHTHKELKVAVEKWG